MKICSIIKIVISAMENNKPGKEDREYWQMGKNSFKWSDQEGFPQKANELQQPQSYAIM